MGCSQSNSVNSSSVTVPGKYIITKKVDGIEKQQYVNITSVNNGIYSYDYGLIGFHEGSCTIKNIRHLTSDEEKLRKENKTSALPQQFYQSDGIIPSGC